MDDTVTITTAEFNALITAVNTGTNLMQQATELISNLLTENAELKRKVDREWNSGYDAGFKQGQVDERWGREY